MMDILGFLKVKNIAESSDVIRSFVGRHQTEKKKKKKKARTNPPLDKKKENVLMSLPVLSTSRSFEHYCCRHTLPPLPPAQIDPAGR